jgi:hypothetical protein
MLLIMENQEIIIIGAGAAGLFAAARCSSTGIKTSVFESMSRPGRKLLITGQGKCNLTNAAELSDFIKHYGDKQRFVKKCLYGFSSKSLIKLLTSQGLITVMREDGKIFPESERASDVLRCLLDMCSKSYIDFHFNSRLTEIKHESGIFTAYTDEGPVASAPRLLISAGGFTFPATGSKGDGFRFASSLGHNIITPRPSLAAVNSVQIC